MTALDMMTAARGQSHIGKWGMETVRYYSERRPPGHWSGKYHVYRE